MKLSIIVTALIAVIEGSFALTTEHTQIPLDASERFNIPTQHDGESDWRRVSDQDIVPLHSKARTGLIPLVVEEGLISALGPRFANVFIEDAASHGTCWSTCASDVIRVAPCLVSAMIAKDSNVLLHCGVDATSICKSLECLPKNHYDSISRFCSHDRHMLADQRARAAKYDYADVKAYILKHDRLAGWRGDIRASKSEHVGLAPNNKDDFYIAECLDCDQLDLKCCGGSGCLPNGMCSGPCC